MSNSFEPKSSGWVREHFGITRGKLDKYNEFLNIPYRTGHESKEKNKYHEYRYEDIEKMWYLHMFSQMEMEMKEIKKIWNQDEFIFRETVIQRIETLEEKKRCIEGMISIAKTCRATGRIPIPEDFTTLSFAEFREIVHQKWTFNNFSSAAISDYPTDSPNNLTNIILSFLSLLVGINSKSYHALNNEERLELSQISLLTIFEKLTELQFTEKQLHILEEQLMNLYPQDINSKEVVEVVAQYCICWRIYIQNIDKDGDYPLNQLADHLSSQFFDGDISVDLIHKYGKERQEYFARAFEYFAENNKFN